MAEIMARALTRADDAVAADALALLNRTQGVGLFGPRYLLDRIEGAQSCVFAAFDGERLAGVASVQVIDRFDYHLPFDPALPRELSGKLVASFNTSSVVEAWQGKGVGRLLMQKRLEWARARGCDVALGVSWVSGLAHTSRRTFDGAGFRAVKRLEGFYRQSSIDHPFDCPGCRASPCGCAAILYRKDL